MKRVLTLTVTILILLLSYQPPAWTDPSSIPPAAHEAIWARTVSAGTSVSTFNDISTDKDGNIYAAGYIEGTGTYTFGPGVTAADTDGTGNNAMLVRYDSDGVAQWARTVSTGTNVSHFEGVAVDTAGNVYAAGFICGTDNYTFGPGVTAAGNSKIANVVLVKYNSSGAAQWAQTVSTGEGRSLSIFTDVAVDAVGNVYAAGGITGTDPYVFGPEVSATGTFFKDSHIADGNAVLVKYNSSGAALWARTVSTGVNSSEFKGISVDKTGNVYAVGEVAGTGTFTFGPGVTAAGTCFNKSNVVLVKYNSGGTAQWARTVSTGSGESIFSSVAIDDAGYVYAAGRIYGTGTFTFSPGVAATGNSGESDNAVLVKYSSNGIARWATAVSTDSGFSYFSGVSIDSFGNVYAAGAINDIRTYTFGPGVTATGTSIYPGLNQAVLVKYNSGGTAQWARTLLSSTSDSMFTDVSADTTANVYAAGMICATGTFGKEIVVTGPSKGYNILLVKYSQ